ncbi:MAG: hypothetical protein LBI86_01680 [Treponema sp.]|nr:hypothetical protein [Treponema sp.]
MKSIIKLIMTAFCLAVFSCDLLSNKSEIDVERAIDEAVRIANAPVINVEVARTIAGISNPAGSLAGIKQGVPFRINFSVNPNYGFIHWAASLNGAALGRDQVEFSAPGQLETMVTVHINPGAETVLVTPLGEGVNSVDDFYVYPEPVTAGAERLVPQEHYVQIRFSKSIAPGSLRFSDGGNFGGNYIDVWPAYSEGGGTPYFLPFGDPGRSFVPQGVFSVEIKHITLRGFVSPPFGYSGFYLENFFYPPLLSADGRTLTLWTRSLRGGANSGKPAFQALGYASNSWWDGTHLGITVTADGSIQDESGLAMGISKSFSYQVTRNSGVTEVPAYTPGLSYNSGNIFPNSVYGNACMILEEKTRGNVIDGGDLINVASSLTPLEVPADGQARWVYIIFQSYNTRWRIAGARIVDKGGFGSADAYVTQGPGQENGWITGSDVPLLGENLLGEQAAASLLTDNILRDKLAAAYHQKMKNNPLGYSDILPVYVVRYRLRGHVPGDFTNPAWNKKIVLAFARVVVEPPLAAFPAGITSEVSFGVNVNRASYPSLSAAWLHVRYAAP